ncbi:hypothetical protein [Pseudomonas huanghezhanensis]|uniref:hypothetical protein n=1 Tax=Pseudomonas huanghezhanensis TaxID=3002903 RepID=UPI002286142A|nr:hypothetical protein [Pseudomonas sp. BSw22131]
MTTTIYWHDIEDSLGHWEGLDLTVASSSTRRPPLHLLTGNNGRMKLMLNDLPLFWATSEHGYDGAWVVRNCLSASMDMSVIPMIRSAEVERHASLAPVERIKAWSRFFVSRLGESASSFLCPGHWLAQGMLPAAIRSRGEAERGPAAWHFSGGKRDDVRFPRWSLYGEDILQSGIPQPVKWHDWNDTLITLRAVDPLSGRLKWWRKKARDGSLPPILLWRISGLSSYVLVARS